MFLFTRISGLALTVALISGPAFVQDRTAALRSRFSKETDPVHKAKLLPQLAESEFREIQPLLDGGNLNEAGAIANQMADEAESAVRALDAKVRDPEKHADGYRQVEISVRGSERRIDDVLVGLSADDQKTFLEVRNRLDDLERHLIRELFPHRPDEPANPVAPKS